MSSSPRMNSVSEAVQGSAVDAYSCKRQAGVAPSGRSLLTRRGWGRMCLRMSCAAHGRAMW